MNGYRKMMIEQGGNLGWCAPYISEDGKNAVVLHEGKIDSILLDGENVKSDIDGWDHLGRTYSEELLNKVAKRMNRYYEDYKGWNVEHIILDSDLQECACCDCPWFGDCAAMDNPPDWEEYGQADEYPDD